ncbi:MBOAT family O-acyltransferase [Candidatus Berkiella aquae]|uniref:Probable alginate O-acetylase n=1 Tax=Candidatus Berkiella aquae TaxID=295108 RepID=A0A0Q9YW32_9GAMM|nr:MBOAT family O-acyltransferase [Candidatus Berkiella aquae]MCS5712309.1 MBOAT family protein [Candidatus Berkiella aquae]
MLFDSYIFIFVFLPVCLLLYGLLTQYKQYGYALSWLVLASLFFYGWWNPPYLILLLTSIAVNFVIGQSLRQRAKQNKSNTVPLVFGVSLNLLFIGYFKYAYFFVSNLNQFTAQPIPFDPIILPLGISFFTFQKIAFLVDASRGEIKDFRFIDYCLFVTFFPQLIAGPIVQHKQIIPQFAFKDKLKISSDNFSIGLTLFLLGLFKKIALADSIAVYANAAFNGAAAGINLSFWEAWLGALAYALQLYFDFSGYSDMAIGLAFLFGIKLPLNFYSPYKAKSIIDFWHRWHMTLSSFLRDYLYIPLGGNRKGPVRRYVNLIITMLLGGLWHGANWTFVLWGMLHGLYLTINHGWRWLFGQRQISPLCCQLVTFFAVVVAWVPFRADNIQVTQSMLTSMFSLQSISLPKSVLTQFSALQEYVTILGLQGKGMFYNGLANWHYGLLWIIGLLGCAWLMPNTSQIMNQHFVPEGIAPERVSASRLSWQPSKRWALLLAMMALISIMLISEESEFLYFQF